MSPLAGCVLKVKTWRQPTVPGFSVCLQIADLIIDWRVTLNRRASRSKNATIQAVIAPLGAITRMGLKQPALDATQIAHPASCWLTPFYYGQLGLLTCELKKSGEILSISPEHYS
jgi:hypothetical protein